MKAIFEVNEVVQKVTDGEINALSSYIELKRLEKGLKAAIATVYDDAITEAATYGEKSFEAFDAKIQCKSAAGTWNFKHIEPIIKLKEQVKDYEQMAKDAYKLIEKGRTVVDENGEVVPPAMYTPGKDIISVSV